MFIAGSNTKFWNFYGVCMPEDTDQTSIYLLQMNIVPLILEQLLSDKLDVWWSDVSNPPEFVWSCMVT